jgi:hypothetical protein
VSTLIGTDNYGKLRQDFADRLTAASDEEFLTIAEQCIWLSACASNNPRSDYHWQVDTCLEESRVRALLNPANDLYGQAWKAASGS